MTDCSSVLTCTARVLAKPLAAQEIETTWLKTRHTEYSGIHQQCCLALCNHSTSCPFAHSVCRANSHL